MKLICFSSLLVLLLGTVCDAATFVGKVVDSETGELLPARIYLQSESGEWLFVESADKNGSTLAYREQWVPMPDSVELHTTISAHPFTVELEAGKYLLVVERGKEYRPYRETIAIEDAIVEHTIPLRRWINLAERGWYSGETHVHRRIQELPNVMLAEQLNVAFPVTYWTVDSDKPPGLEPSSLRRQGPSPFGPREDHGAQPIRIDQHHVIFPRNTEYEVFSVKGQRHTLGAIFVLNHHSVFTQLAPPIAAIAEQAHQEGALLDLDKHSWPWSMMLVPIAKIDLFELSNNSVWRTNFGFKRTSVPPAEWMHLEREGPDNLTEWGWLNYGFEVYYALLNCGFRLAPTAGTASGVHPVPLGYSRVYVHTGSPFTPAAWLDGLRQGNSFVTTGPMLFATVNDQRAGAKFESGEPTQLKLEIESVSEKKISSIDVLVNGQIVKTIAPNATLTPTGAWRSVTRESIEVTESSWLAVRSTELQSDGRKRFAHTAPWFVTIDEQSIRPRREQVEYFIGLIENEITRNQSILEPAALDEFKQALEAYKTILARAK